MTHHERSPVQLFWAACLFAAIAAGGAMAAYAAVKDFAYARASGRWEQVDGVVLSPNSTKGGLRYAYFYNGEGLEGARFAFLTRGRIGAPPPTKPGDQVMVYVAPEDPTLSVLVPGGSGRRFVIWFAGAGLIAFIGVGGLIRSTMMMDFPELSRLDRDDHNPGPSVDDTDASSGEGVSDTDEPESAPMASSRGGGESTYQVHVSHKFPDQNALFGSSR